MHRQSYDIAIIGAGPAGTAAAMALRDTSLSVALIDKSKFPRDKTCGDALSADVINQLRKLSPNLAHELGTSTMKTQSGGVRIVAPNNRAIDIPFRAGSDSREGYVCRRMDFDLMMLNEARRSSNLTVLEGREASDVRVNNNEASIQTNEGTITAKVIIGADGAHSVVKRALLPSGIDPQFHSAGLRMYHRQLAGFNTGNFIELYFLRDILPGYLWVFPLPDGNANVGIGMLTSAVSSRRINLRKTFHHLLSTHPLLESRFKNAVRLEPSRGFGLPLGGAHRPMSGERLLLTGDAASLIDPFSGEGIGNAIRSGRFAAAQALQCINSGDFSSNAMHQYDDKMYGMLKDEFRVSRAMLRLCKYPMLFNTIVNKANRNAQIHQTLIDALAFPGKKGWLVNPVFYFNLLFRS